MKRESPPLLCLFEKALDGWLLAVGRRSRYGGLHVSDVKPLLDAGHVEQTAKKPNWPDASKFPAGPPKGRRHYYFEYKATASGVLWWARERVHQYEREHGPISVDVLLHPPVSDWRPSYQPYRMLDWGGIGAELCETWPPRIEAVVKGVSLGLFELTGHDNGNPSFWRMGESIRARVTKAGYEYFSKLPRLELECG